MKHQLVTRPLLAIALLLALGLGGLAAQNCTAYFPMKSGASFVLTHYDVKDKVTSSTQTTIAEKEATASKIVATAHSTSLDAKGKELSKSDFDVTCENGEFRMDMKSMGGPQSQMQNMQNVEIKMESSDMIFPGELTVGQTLPDASMHMTGTMNGMKIMDNTTTVTNRKVVGKESITTPAGTFDCVIIEEDSKMATSMGMGFEIHTKSWFALNVGMVRTESTRNGKPNGYSLLTKFSGN